MANGNGTGQGSALANKLKAALGRIITLILSQDWISSIKNFLGVVVRISIAIVISLVPIGLAYLFLRPKSEGSGGPVIKAMDRLEEFLLGTSSEDSEVGTSSEDSENPAFRVLDFLEHLPTEPVFYYSIVAFAGVYLGWRWWSHAKYRNGFERARKENEDESSLTPRDWWVVQGLRERAVALRIQADWILGGIFLLLSIGIYLILFVLPHVERRDAKLAAQKIAQEEEQKYKSNIKNIFDLVVKGQYWLKIPSDLSNYEGYGFEDINMRHKQIDVEISPTASTLKIEDGGKRWNRLDNLSLMSGERITAAAFSADGRAGVVAGDEGSVFLTRDGGESWSPPSWSLRDAEWITAAAFSADGRAGVVAGDEGSVFLTGDGGESWSPPSWSLRDAEWITAAAFSADGRAGVVAGDEGSVFLTGDGGESWSPPSWSLRDAERVTAAAFSADGRAGVVAGNEGSVFLTRDGGESWSPPSWSLRDAEWITATAFSADGRAGVVAGNKGSVFLTGDGGESWSPPSWSLRDAEWITAAAFSADGRAGVVAGDEGSVFLTGDGGESWSPPSWSLRDTEWITAAAFSADGRAGVVAGDEGSVFLTGDGGESWSTLDPLLDRGERVTAAALSADGNTGLIHSITTSISIRRDKENRTTPDSSSDPENILERLLSLNLGSDLPVARRERVTTAVFSPDGKIGVVSAGENLVFMTRNNGESWSILEWSLRPEEQITAVAFSEDGRTGVVAGDEGSVFLTGDGGEKWSTPDWSLGLEEQVTAVAFSEDGRIGVIAGNKNTVFLITRDDRENWKSESTEGEGLLPFDPFSSVIWVGDKIFLAETENGVRYLLKSFREFDKLSEMSLDNIYQKMGEDRILEYSRTHKDIGSSMYKISRLTNENSGGSSESNSKEWFSDILSDIMAMRVVTLIALLFLVHILVRLHQYSLRLAAFWDARADAVLLAQSFAYHSAETFDDLVAALAPDAYDFKPPPKSGHEGVMNLVGQLLRREPRKS